MKSNTFYVRGKANGVPFSKALPGLGLIQPVGKVEKGRAPDFVQQETLSESAAIVYRLSGDYNPHWLVLHCRGIISNGKLTTFLIVFLYIASVSSVMTRNGENYTSTYTSYVR